MIRKATISDAIEISIIEKENFEGFFRRKEETIKKMILNKKFEVYIDEYSGIVGYIFLELVSGSLYIENISVEKKSQGIGVGKDLMLFAENLSKKIGYKAITLDVIEKNEVAVGLYKKFGYKVYKRGKSQVKMFKKLT